jgi:hypothetical protein
MASVLLTEQDFRGDINVPNTADSLVCEELRAIIETYEPQFFDEVLGVAFAAEFYSAAGQATVDPQWQDLINGKVWTDDHSGTSVTRRHRGLKYAAARYVYWYWQRTRGSLTTGVGEVVPSAENSTVIAPIGKQVQAWNQMAGALPDIWQFIQYYQLAGTAAFPTFDRTQPKYHLFRTQNVLNL